MKKEALALLLGYLRSQKEEIKRIFIKLKAVEPANEEKTVYLAYSLHNLYCAFEDLFLEIAKTFENRIEDPSKYHRELLRKMAIEVPFVRPSVISKGNYQILDELRRFRHVFRHAYTYDIEPDKLKNLKQKLIEHFENLMLDLENFERFIERALKE